jgi:hypothetical protein
MEGSVVVSEAGEKERGKLHDKRNSNCCDSKTQENTYMSEVDRRKISI